MMELSEIFVMYLLLISRRKTVKKKKDSIWIIYLKIYLYGYIYDYEPKCLLRVSEHVFTWPINSEDYSQKTMKMCEKRKAACSHTELKLTPICCAYSVTYLQKGQSLYFILVH